MGRASLDLVSADLEALVRIRAGGKEDPHHNRPHNDPKSESEIIKQVKQEIASPVLYGWAQRKRRSEAQIFVKETLNLCS